MLLLVVNISTFRYSYLINLFVLDLFLNSIKTHIQHHISNVEIVKMVQTKKEFDYLVGWCFNVRHCKWITSTQTSQRQKTKAKKVHGPK